MASESNIDDIGRWLDELVATVSFQMPGRDSSLGLDMAGIVAQGIADRTVADQKDAGGGNLKANEAKYAKYKASRYGSHQPLVRTGQMLSLQSLLGETTVAPDEVTMVYGTGEAPSGRSSTGTALTDQDERTTDRVKAGHVSDERPFYALDDAIAEACIREASEVLDEHLAR